MNFESSEHTDKQFNLKINDNDSSNSESFFHSLPIEAYLKNQEIEYDLKNTNHTYFLSELVGINKMPYANALKAQIIEKQDKARILIIAPFNRVFDYKAICSIFDEEVRPVDFISFKDSVSLNENLVNNLYDKQLESFVPLGDLLNIQVIIDNSIKINSENIHNVYFVSGLKNTLLSISMKNFIKLNASYKQYDITLPFCKIEISNKEISILDNGSNQISKFNKLRMKSRIEGVFELPVMPQTLKKVLAMKSEGNYSEDDIIKLSLLDPSLSAQLIAWASSPYYGKQGKIDSVDTAVKEILGKELSMNVLVGISLGNRLNMPVQGTIGILNILKKALYTAKLAQILSKNVTSDIKINSKTAYLCGLLHDFGYFVMGNLFFHQYETLLSSLNLNKDICPVKIENHLFHINHQDIGALLAKSWNFPEEITDTIQNHHNPNYSGRNCTYTNLVLLSDLLLKSKYLDVDIKDINIPSNIWNSLGIKEVDAKIALDKVWSIKANLDSFIYNYR